MFDTHKLPFIHLANDEEYYSALSSLRYGNVLNYDRLMSMKLNIFDTNVRDNINIPSYANDPDANCNIYRQLANEDCNICDYYTIDQLCIKTKQYKKNELSLLHHNVRSLPAHIDNLEIQLKAIDYPFKIIGLSETWLKPHNLDLYNIEGYNSVHRVRENQKGGGVALLIDKDVIYKERKDIENVMENDAECVFVEVDKSVFNTSRKLLIGEIYKPPNTSIVDFCTKMEALLSKINGENAVCYLMGDYNINLLKADVHAPTNDFLDLIVSNGYVPLINRPTRVTEFTATLIDQVFTNAIDTLNPSRYINGIIYSDVSDHFPIIHICKTHEKSLPDKGIYSFQDMSDCNLSKLKQSLGNADWSCLYNELDANVCYDKFECIFDKVYKKCIPVRKGNQKDRDKPWMSVGMINSVKRKNKLYHMYLKHPNATTEARYKAYKNKLNHVLRVSKRRYINDQLNSYIGDMKNTWRVLNTIIDNKNRVSRLPERFNCGDVTLDDPLKIANHFNEYFVNMGPNMAKSMSKTNIDPLLYVEEQTSKFTLESISERELSIVMNGLKDTSPGYDGFKAKAVIYTKNELLRPLCHIINRSLEQGLFPTRLKHAIVTPIHKDGERTVVKNYRPISVLSVFSKLYERVMYNQLLSYLDVNNLLYKHQYGFRSGHSTDQALIHMTDNIRNALDKNEHFIGVFMDLAKAFDSLNHHILLGKLQRYGLEQHGNAYKWLSSYLHDRYQQVKFNGVLSNKSRVKCGVPQGSQLGPLLFLLFINDLCKSSDILTFILFADDTNAFIKGKDITNTINVLNAELVKVAIWFHANQLSLNIKKTKYMIFSNKQSMSNHSVNIRGVELECVPSIKFLGVMVDNKLSWKEHIMYIRNKLSKSIAILYKVNRVLSTNCKLQLYKSFIQPHLIYCNIVWCSIHKTTLKPLTVLQKRALKLALNLPILTPSVDVFCKSKVHDLIKINNTQVAIFMFKYTNNLLPKGFSGKYDINANVHSHYTRASGLYHVPMIRLNRSKFAMDYKGVSLWNSLPANVRNISTLSLFKTTIKKHDFEWS